MRSEVVHIPGKQNPEGEDDHPRQRGGRQDGAHVVEHLETDAPRVEAADVEGGQGDRAVRDQPHGRRTDDARAAGSEVGGEPGREEHHGVEHEGAARPGRDGTKTLKRERVGLLEPDRLEYRQRLSFRQGSRSHALDHRRSVGFR